jgi:hypothetical protein
MRAELSLVTIGAYEQGRRQPRPRQRLALANSLHLEHAERAVFMEPAQPADRFLVFLGLAPTRREGLCVVCGTHLRQWFERRYREVQLVRMYGQLECEVCQAEAEGRPIFAAPVGLDGAPAEPRRVRRSEHQRHIRDVPPLPLP